MTTDLPTTPFSQAKAEDFASRLLSMLNHSSLCVMISIGHRTGLFDAVLLKDTHVRLAGGVTRAVQRSRVQNRGVPIEVEAQTLTEVNEALAARADAILLDNMTMSDVRKAVDRAKGRAKIEISGGVTLDRIPELAKTGADFVSIGALTHSAPAVDISFEIEPL